MQSDAQSSGRRRGRPPSLDRAAVLDATWRVIARRGLDRARFQDIARESGVAVSTLQHAFGRLDEILEAGLQRAQELDDAFLAELPGAGERSAWARLEAFVTGALATQLPDGSGLVPDVESWLVWVERWRAAARDDGAADRLYAAYVRWWRVAEQIIRDGQRDGSFAADVPVADAAVAINGLLDGVAASMLLRRDGGDLEDAVRVVLFGARQMLGVVAAPASPAAT